MARPATPRRPAGYRTGSLDRSARRHVPTDLEPAHPRGSSPAGADAVLPTAPRDEAAAAEVTPDGCWARLPAAERDRLGLRLSRLVLKALRPPDVEEDC